MLWKFLIFIDFQWTLQRNVMVLSFADVRRRNFSEIHVV